MDWLLKFVLSYAASFVAGLTLGIVGTLWPRELWPRLRGLMLGKGVNISGKWRSTFVEKDEKYNEDIQIKQVGERITGIITLVDDEEADIDSEEDEEDAFRYKFTGTCKDTVIKGLYDSVSESGFEQGTFFLRLTPNGKKAEGNYLLFSKEDKKTADITPVEYKWERARE